MRDLEVLKMNKDRISYKDLYELIDRHINVVNENIKETNVKLDNLSNKVEEIRVQTTRTNGRVNTLETWESDVNKIIEEIKCDNREQDKKLNMTSKELAMISVKVAGILTAIGFFVYILTGYVI